MVLLIGEVGLLLYNADKKEKVRFLGDLFGWMFLVFF